MLIATELRTVDRFVNEFSSCTDCGSSLKTQVRPCENGMHDGREYILVEKLCHTCDGSIPRIPEIEEHVAAHKDCMVLKTPVGVTKAQARELAGALQRGDREQNLLNIVAM